MKADILAPHSETAMDSSFGKLHEVISGIQFRSYFNNVEQRTINYVGMLAKSKKPNYGLINRLSAYLSDATKKGSLMIRLAAMISRHKLSRFKIEPVFCLANLSVANLNEDGLMMIGQQWTRKGYKEVQSTTVYDELCSPPDKSIEEAPLSDDKELIHINDGHTDVVLVDPALKLIADQLDSEFEDEKADREGQDAA